MFRVNCLRPQKLEFRRVAAPSRNISVHSNMLARQKGKFRPIECGPEACRGFLQSEERRGFVSLGSSGRERHTGSRRSGAWIALFSSTPKTAALTGGLKYKPNMLMLHPE